MVCDFSKDSVFHSPRFRSKKYIHVKVFFFMYFCLENFHYTLEVSVD